MRGLLVRTAFLSATLLAAEAALGATPVGDQFQVNSYRTAFQGYSGVAVDADGDFFVVVWDTDGSAGSRCYRDRRTRRAGLLSVPGSAFVHDGELRRG